MLYSHNLENEKLKQFTVLLNHAARGEAQYASIVNDVILETHQYVAGQKTLYNINRDLIHIILLLSDTNRDYFRQLDNNTAQYNEQTYSKVLEIIKQPLHSNPI